VCLYVYQLIVAGQQLGRNLTAVTNTHATTEELFIGSEVLMAVTMKATTSFWDVTSCSPVEVCLHFGGMYCLHLQG
jgi:hypothetical protein